VIVGMLAMLSAGCADDGRAKVSGRVTYNGQPLATGSIAFIGDNYQTATTVLASDGSYSMRAALGTNKVVIASRDESLGEPTVDGLPKKISSKSHIPEYYADHAKSGLTADVVSGSNSFDFALKD
jgi:hypothetical protein